MKKVLAIAVAVALCLCLTACKQPAAPQNTPAETLKIGVLCTSDAETVGSEAAAVKAQLQDAVERVGLQAGSGFLCDEISLINPNFTVQAVEDCIAAGCTLVVGTQAAFTPTLKQKAAQYPSVTFIGVGEKDDTLTNFFTFEMRLFEGAFLAGIVAGACSAADTIGCVVPFADENETCLLLNAFLLGARVHNPQATLSVKATGSAQNTAQETAAVKALQNEGCDLLCITTRGDGAFKAADAAQMKAVTVYTAPEDANGRLLFSVMPRFTEVLVDALQTAKSDTPPFFHDTTVGYTEGFLDCTFTDSAHQHAGNPYSVYDAAQRLLLEDAFSVFSGYTLQWERGTLAPLAAAVQDNNGTLRIPAAAAAPTPAFLRQMNWLADGISVTSS